MKRILATWKGWSVRTRVLLVAGLTALVAGVGIAAYLNLKRDGDAGCEPDCPELSVEKKRKPPPEAKTVAWPEYGFDDSRTRFLATQKVSPPFGGSEWSLNLGKLLEFSPVIYRDEMYLMDKDATFYAIDVDTGKVLWKRSKGKLNASSPSGGSGLLYGVTLDPGNVFAVDPKNGKTVWNKPLPGRSETSPLVHGKKVYVGSESGDVFALNRRTGAIKWQHATAGPVKGALAFSDGTIYGANYAGEVFALDAGNGQTKWQNGTQGSSFGRTGSIYSTPAVAYGRVFLGSIDGRIYSFDASNGELVWSKSTGAEVYPGPAVADVKGAPPTVFIGSADQNFYALDAMTGDVRWQQDVGGVVLGAASVVGRTAYVGVIGPNIGSFGFDAETGRKVFEHEFGEYNPVISDGEKLYLTGYNGIRAFMPEDKKPARKGGSKGGGTGGSKGGGEQDASGGSKGGGKPGGSKQRGGGKAS